VMAVLTAVLLPAVAGFLRDQKIVETAETLADLQNSITTFKATVGTYPSRLTHLGKAITANDTTSCTGRAPATPLTAYAASSTVWKRGGPYYPRATSDKGFDLPIGTASDTLFRTSSSTTTGFLGIKMPLVPIQDARALNGYIDGTTDLDQGDRSNTTGTIQWGVPDARDRVDVIYYISVSRVC
jgi:type II secretory pathway pseudopilin PulG